MTGDGASPWGAGRLRGRGRDQLLFGATYEDAAIDQELLGACAQVFAIGSAGDTSMCLGRSGRHVTAVDVNSSQVHYLRERLEGGPRRRGAAERLLDAARVSAPLAGWSRRRVLRFLELSDVSAQRRVFDRVLDTRRFRVLLDVGLAPASLLGVYRPEFVSFLPRRFGRVLRNRLRRGVLTHANARNPYAPLLFAAVAPRVEQPPPGSIDAHHAEAATFLESQRAGTFDGFTLSNVLDGPDRGFRVRLGAAVARAGTPDAPVVLRTLREPADTTCASWAARDRSMIWGGILVTTAAEFPAALRTLE